MIAFGPVAEETELMEFLKWCTETDKPDLRTVPEVQLMSWYAEFQDEFQGDMEVANAALRVVSEEG